MEKNAEEFAIADEALEDYKERQEENAQERIAEEEEAKRKAEKAAELAAKSVTIPAPPADGFGNLAPPDGYNWAYCPAKREGMIVNGE